MEIKLSFINDFEQKYPQIISSICHKEIKENACSLCAYPAWSCKIERTLSDDNKVFEKILSYMCMYCDEMEGKKKEFNCFKEWVDQGIGSQIDHPNAHKYYDDIKNGIISEPPFISREEYEEECKKYKSEASKQAQKILETIKSACQMNSIDTEAKG